MWKQYQPTEIVFGEGAVKDLPAMLTRYHAERCLLVADPFWKQNGFAEMLAEKAGGRIVEIFSDVEPNPTLQNINDCARRVRESAATFLLAVGGGSAIDCAKCASVSVAMDCSAEALLQKCVITAALPIGIIPTTAGTGSELTAGAVLSDRNTHHKDAIFSPLLFAKFAVIDPELTYSCPPKVTATSGIDVLMHALDALSSVKANPLTDSMAVQAGKLVFDNLPLAIADGHDCTARVNMSIACTFAAMAFSQTGTTGSHASSYILTEVYGLPHGEACAFTADAWLRENAKGKPALHDRAREMGFKDAFAMADALHTLKKACGFRTTLAEAGIPEADLDRIAKSTLEAGNYGNNVAQLSQDEVRALLTVYA